MVRRRLMLLVAAILSSSLLSSSVGYANADAPPRFKDTVYADGLTLPTTMEFAPDGRLFVSEKGGDLRVIKDGELLPSPFASIQVNSEDERGLMGIAFDPDFESNGNVYVYHTTSSSPIHNRVLKLTADPADPDRALATAYSILDLEESHTTSHIGGGLEFGKDGKLYVSTGEDYYPYLAQSLSSRFGKILRINADGTIPSDNPFYNVEGAYREIWALGLRNPFTFAFSPAEGSDLMYINDVGQDSWEEINMGSEGANFGWPDCEGVCSDPRFEDPVYYYPHPDDGGSAIAGAAFYEAEQFPSEYRGSYFFGDYINGFIKRLTPDNEMEDFLTNIDSPVDIEIGPDGSLYYLSIRAGEVHKVQYGGLKNHSPSAEADAVPASGPSPLTVTFGAFGSSDRDGDELGYSWDFGDGSPSATGAMVTHTYDEPGRYDATLTVTDGRGGVDTDTVSINVEPEADPGGILGGLLPSLLG